MFLTTRVLHLAEGALLRSWTSGLSGPLSRRAETRLNVPTEGGAAGEIEFHPLDSQHARRVHFGVWRFEELLDLSVLRSALHRTIARYPVVAGWLEGSGKGRMWIQWDSAAADRGVVFVTAEARGAAPDGPYDGVNLQDGGFLPPMRGHCLMSVQATHFPESGSTLLVVSVDHAVTDVSGLMDFITTWCHACSDIKAAAAAAAGGGAPVVRTTLPLPPDPVWDRSLLIPRAKAAPPCDAGLLRVPSDAGTSPLSSCDTDTADGSESVVSSPRLKPLPAAAEAAPAATGLVAGAAALLSRSVAAWTGGAVNPVAAAADWTTAPAAADVTSPAAAPTVDAAAISRNGSLSSGTEIEACAPQPLGDAIHSQGLLGASSHKHIFWDGPSVWKRDPLCAATTLVLATRYLYLNPECRSQTWKLPRAAITSLKTLLGGAMGPKSPTANDLVSALLLAGSAARQPAVVARRGGVNLGVVVNGRGGRFGLDVPNHYFGNVSLVVLVWVPASLLLPADGSAPTGLPTPELVAHVHAAVRAALGPDGLTALRAKWMAAAHEAGVSAKVRTHELGDFFDGDVGVDNVSNYPIFDFRFGASAAPSSANLRFFLPPRLAWITAATGPGAAAGGASGDLHVTLTLPQSVWAGVGPAWEAAGMERVRDQSAVHDIAMHPASLRSMFSELFRTPLRRLG